MITPRFSCSQTEGAVIVSIYCPSIRVRRRSLAPLPAPADDQNEVGDRRRNQCRRDSGHCPCQSVLPPLEFLKTFGRRRKFICEL